MMNPWCVLGVHRKSSDAEIRDAYYALAKKLHPDAGGPYDYKAFTDVAAAFALIETAKVRKVVLEKTLYHCKDCKDCKGTGTISKAKGLTKKTHTACSICCGAGLIIKENDDVIRSVELRGTSGASSKRHYKRR